jgi:hypothetical protein
MQQFFQQFNFGPPQDVVVDNSTPEMRHNYVVLEMYNNWPFVRWMMYKHKNGLLKQTDEMENLWLSYIMQNNIPTEEDKDGSRFLRENLKVLSEENKVQ